MRVPMPGRLGDAARAFTGDPPPARDASTVIVLRDGAEGVEAFLMRRQTSMAFAAGMYVFPGGGLAPSDVSDDVAWVGPPPSVWAERLRCDEDLARGLVVAAARETFEETGVLLAGPDEHTVLASTSSPEMVVARDRLEDGELSFGAFLREHDLVLRTDLIAAWAHWITPAFEPRRYDARFFVTVMPDGQEIGTMSREADHTVWAPLHRVLAAVEAGEAAMMPPTVAACREVAQHTAATILDVAATRTFPTVEPRLVEVDGELFLETDLGETS